MSMLRIAPTAPRRPDRRSRARGRRPLAARALVALAALALAAVAASPRVAIAAEGQGTLVSSLAGRATSNISANNYTTWASTVKSYLAQNDDGTLTRVEYDRSAGDVLVETYSADLDLVDSRTIPCELPIFGGFYSGSSYNYFVFGLKNPEESDDAVVFCVTQYDKSWNKRYSINYMGANTYVPFSAGSLRMAEDDGKIYIYTCHEMYATSDGVHHQANMTYVVDASNCLPVQRFYGIANIGYGYVSHSFNQFVATDGDYVYRVDHGDAYPRSVGITRCTVGGSITSVSYADLLKIQGETGANATGVSVGGLALSSTTCLVVGNTVSQSGGSYSASGTRNVFVCSASKSSLKGTTTMLTSYGASDGVTVRTPQIVGLGNDSFLVMWEEARSGSSKVVTRMVTVGADGKATSSVATTGMRLSDCQPILLADGRVAWYVSTSGYQGNACVLYEVDPSDIDALDGSDFDDVSLSDWSYGAVMSAASRGLVGGYAGTDNFGPWDTLTRAQAAVILWRHFEPEEAARYASVYPANTTGLADVESGSWYTAAANWAVAKGVINGVTQPDGSRRFDPYGMITRQQLCTIVANASRELCGNSTAASQAALQAMPDAADVESWARDSIAWCLQSGVISGVNEGGTRYVRPRLSVDRSTMVTVMINALDAGLLD